MKIPHIILKAKNNYDLGYQIGNKLKKHIQRSLARKINHISNPILSQNIKKSYQYLLTTNKYFPLYVKELEGLAYGAEVSFDQIFLVNCREIYDDLDQQRCTTVAVPYQNGYVIGHNEDWEQGGDIYIFTVTLDNMVIFGLNYFTEIMGNAICVNSHSTVQAINDLAHTGNKIGVPKNFIARDILSKRSIEQIISVFSYCPRASGFNHVILTKERRLFNVESTAEKIEIQEIGQEKFIHTNHYLGKLRMYERWPHNRAFIRYKKAKQLIKVVNTIEDVKRFLRKNDGYPISIMNDETNASIVINMQDHSVEIAFGNNPKTKYTQYKIDFEISSSPTSPSPTDSDSSRCGR